MPDYEDHKNILIRDDPDSGYEYFWMNFKSSVSNIAGLTSNPSLIRLGMEVNEITDRLNTYKVEAQYDRIGQQIQDFLKQFFWHILSEDQHNMAIAYTNFKRWIKYCKLRRDIPMPNITPMDPLDDPQMQYLYFVHQLKGILTISIKCYSTELYLQDMSTPDSGRSMVLKWAVNEQSVQLLNKLLEHYPDWTSQAVLSEYEVQLPKGIKDSTKAIKLLSR